MRADLPRRVSAAASCASGSLLPKASKTRLRRPDVNYPWVDTPAEFFERCMRYLKENGFDVIALRDLERFVEPATPAAARL